MATIKDLEGGAELSAHSPFWHTGLVLTVLFGPLLLQLRHLTHPQQADSVALFYLVAVLYQSVLIGLVWWGLAWDRSAIEVILGSAWRTLPVFIDRIALGLGAGILLTGLTWLLGILLGPFYKTGDEFIQMSLLESSWHIVLFIPLVFLTGFCEELVFRGYLFRQSLWINGSVKRSLLAQAAAFAFYHGFGQTPAGVLHKVMFALLLGVLSYRCKSLLPAIVAHSFNNLFFAFLAYAFH